MCACTPSCGTPRPSSYTNPCSLPQLRRLVSALVTIDDIKAPSTLETLGKQADCRHTRNYLWAELMRRSLGLDVLACPRCGGRLTLIALIEDPAVIVRVLGHLGLPIDIPAAQPARAPPLHLVGDAPPTEVAGDQISSTNPPDPACSPSARQTCASASESRLTAAPRTGMLDTIRSVEARHPWVQPRCQRGDS